MATHNHEVLKIKAIEWLYLVMKCKYIAPEIKIGKYIFDVVGCDGSRIYIIEAKQERGDFLRECNDPKIIKQNIQEYRKLLKETIEVKKYKELIKKEREKSIKFFDDSIYKLSTFRYIIAPDGMIKKEELPENWGLLNENPLLVKKCIGHKIDQRFINKIIMDICKKQTKNFLIKNVGVEFNKVIEFPDIYLK